MARQIPEPELNRIEDAVRGHDEGASFNDIDRACPGLPRRTLQARIKKLVDAGRLTRVGERRGARYFIPALMRYSTTPLAARDNGKKGLYFVHEPDFVVPLSSAGAEIQRLVSQPILSRTPVGYDPTLLDDYVPNRTYYLSESERDHLLAKGKSEAQPAPAGTHARDILNRLLIDLSWNSSRLEGNTYSLLDTERLIALGKIAEGKNLSDATMILNHKAAIEFLVENASEIDLEPVTILNLHALLATDLLSDPDSPGRLRRLPVGISGSVYHPLAVPQVVEECFNKLLAKAVAIEDPFEQAFFVLLHLPYLQPFEDVNKRVSRLASNIPLIRRNLAPISFTDVSEEVYVQGILGIYEFKRSELLRDLFIWAYERSAAKYAVQRQVIGEPDPFRLRWRADLQALVREVIQQRMTRVTAARYIEDWARRHVSKLERTRFSAMVEAEVIGLRESNFARYRVRPSEYHAWRVAWAEGD